MDEKTVRKVKEKIFQIAEESQLDIEQLIIFGSRAREDYTEDSDVDIVIVSEGFEGTEWYKRGQEFHFKWDYQEMPEPEIICLTPEEYRERSQKLGDVVRKASKEGIQLA